jgi:nitroreductase
MTGSEFHELVRSSRTVRRFDEGSRVTREQLLGLVDAARLAPTGNNTQLLRFHVVDDSKTVEHCAASHGWAALFKDWDGPKPGERPTGYIAVCAPAGATGSAIRNLDAGIAAQTIMLAARSEGLGGCIVKSFRPSLADDLGISRQGYEILVLLAIGVPAERVVLEGVDPDRGTHYWRDEKGVHHVPKLPLGDLLI